MNSFLDLILVLASLGSIVLLGVIIKQIIDQHKQGHEYQSLNFVGVHFALPPKVFGSKEVVSETVIVKLEAGTKGAETVRYDTDFYDYDLGRWSKFPSTEVQDFKVVKWVPFPKAE